MFKEIGKNEINKIFLNPVVAHFQMSYNRIKKINFEKFVVVVTLVVVTPSGKNSSFTIVY
jgi:hypothetical protein